MRRASRESFQLFAATMVGFGIGSMAVGALYIAADSQPTSGYTPEVAVGLDDLGSLGEGIVFIGDQGCPSAGRLPGIEEGLVIEHQGGGDSGYIYAVEPAKVYQTSGGANIYCGPASEGMGTTFQGNALVIAGPNTQISPDN